MEYGESVECVEYLTRCFHGLLVLLCEAGKHLSLEASRKCKKRQKADDNQAELPAEVEGDNDGHANVGQRVQNHSNL